MELKYKRKETSRVRIGRVTVGGDAPIALQSMTNTSTTDTAASVEQILRIAEAGGDIVRLTAQGFREAENLREIEAEIRRAKCGVPLVADIHFNPAAAEVAARYVEKVRINPGNFVDPARTFKKIDYTDEEYIAELQRLKERFLPLLAICREHKTALRIGVNHGSLSDRIMNRYGDTPNGMVESCLEFLRICRDEHFADVVISIKASNTVVMVQTVRLLAQRMADEAMNFPLHLGVTEAGDGEDGRIKSAVGIGTLLAEGYGDTVRVSLSEAPEKEIPVARKLVDYVTSFADAAPFSCPELSDDDFRFSPSKAVLNIGGDNLPVVIGESDDGASRPDFVLKNNKIYSFFNKKIYSIINSPADFDGEPAFLSVSLADASPELFAGVKGKKIVFLLKTETANPVLEQRVFFAKKNHSGCQNPVVIQRFYDDELETFQLKSAVDCGALLIDGFADGILLRHRTLPFSVVNSAAFAILQAAHRRVSRTEYVSCPGCGRTLYDLESVIRQIKEKTSKVKNLKIGIMGCIVNGPGEMADADYGYVGAARGKVSLYKKRECVEKNVPQEEAVDRLVALIKANGDWIE